MAFLSKQRTMWFFLALVVFHVSQTSAAAIDRVQKLCSFTKDPSQCVQLLRPDPRAANATYPQLGKISFELAVGATVSAQELSMSLLEQEKDPKVKPRFAGCVEAYKTAESRLSGECANEIVNGELYCLLALFAGVQNCDAMFEAPSEEPTALKNVGDKVKLLGDMVCQTSAAAIDRVQKLCSFTTDPSQCLQLLRPNPRTVNATYPQLGKVSFDLTVGATVSAQELSKSLMEQEKDPKVKPRFAGCLEAYKNAEASLLGECAKEIVKGEPYCLLTMFADVRSCREFFVAPPVEPTALKNVGDKVELLGNMVNLGITLKD
nr:pectinesterase inhibitor-like [Ipomoea trifida]